MSLILLKSQLFISKFEKKGGLSGLSVANPKFSDIAFSVGYLFKAGSLESSFERIDELVCSKSLGLESLLVFDFINPNLSFQIKVLRGLGWDLTMLGGQ
jgi:hypothetical protein